MLQQVLNNNIGINDIFSVNSSQRRQRLTQHMHGDIVHKPPLFLASRSILLEFGTSEVFKQKIFTSEHFEEFGQQSLYE